MKRFLKLTCLAALCAFAVSCHRQEIETIDTSKVRVPIYIDWSHSEVNPQNVSMFFYHAASGDLAFEHYFENNNNAIQSYVSVPVGKYTVVVFNELPNQIKNVKIINREKLNTLEAYGVPAQEVSVPTKGDVYWSQPGALASLVIDNFEVTPEMLYYANLDGGLSNTRCSGEVVTNEQLMNIVPIRRLTEFTFKLKVDGLNNSRMPILGNLRNMAGGYYFKTDKDDLSPVTYQFFIKDRQFDEGSKTKGTITGSVSIFGLLNDKYSDSDIKPDQPILLDLHFMLVDKDKTIVSHSFNITDIIKISEENDGMVLIDADIAEVEVLPDVIPEDSPSSGFETSVADWDVIDVPLVNP